MNTQSETADVDAFTDEMGENPLGDRVDLKAIGPYIVELYERPIMTDYRRRNGLPVQAVVDVHEKVPEDEEHYRGWYSSATGWFEEERARAEYSGLQSAEGVEAFIEEHAE